MWIRSMPGVVSHSPHTWLLSDLWSQSACGVRGTCPDCGSMQTCPYPQMPEFGILSLQHILLENKLKASPVRVMAASERQETG